MVLMIYTMPLFYLPPSLSSIDQLKLSLSSVLARISNTRQEWPGHQLMEAQLLSWTSGRDGYYKAIEKSWAFASPKRKGKKSKKKKKYHPLVDLD